MNSIQNEFRLATVDEITHFFPAKKHDAKEWLVAKKQRICHFLRTGIWINSEKLFDCAYKQRFQPEEKRVSHFFQGLPLHRNIQRCESGMQLPKPALLQKVKDAVLFIFAYIKKPGSVGSVIPSSDSLAKEIISQIPKGSFDDAASARLILEVGPGTGAFSDQIIKRMGKNDQLHLVEYDEAFCKRLQNKYKDLPNVKVIHASIADYMPEEKYDYVVSGLPLNEFPASFVQNVFDKYASITKPGGKMSYFEYAFVPKIALFFATQKSGKNLRDVLHIKETNHRNNFEGNALVWSNFPPAKIRKHVYRTA